MSQLSLFSRRVMLPEGETAATLTVADGKITAIARGDSPAAGAEDLGDKVILPGLIDPHVHVNEPGRTEWEGFYTATRAAAAGGVTALVDMPLNSDPVTTSRAAFAAKREAAAGQCWIDTGFWGGVIPGNADQLAGMVEDGILGFKAFLVHSGIDDFPQSRAEDLEIAMPILARCGVPQLIHAELEGDYEPQTEELSRSYQAFLASRPNHWEDRAIRMMIDLCRATNCRTHIVHLSSASALEDIQRAKAEGLPFSVETCPHYLYFAAESIPDGHPEYKCMPPIREGTNQEGLWQGLRSGLIDCVVTDHSPCTPGLKHLEAGDVLHAWGGIASLQFGLPSVWTRARSRGFALADLVRLMAANSARLPGLQHRKGSLEVGKDADLVVFDPDAEFVVTPEMIHFKHQVTPYASQRLSGVVERTYLRGQLIYAEGSHQGQPQGEFLLKR